MSLLIRINFDGACDNSMFKRLGVYPPIGLGIAVFINNNYSEELSKFAGIPGKIGNNSNLGEWLACVEAFKLASELFDSNHKDTFEIYSDSDVITNQYNGVFEFKQKRYIPYYREAKEYAHRAGIRYHKINWVLREYNKEADILSKKGIALINSQNVCDTRCV